MHAPECNGRLADNIALQGCAAYRRDLRTGRYAYVSPVVADVTGFSAEEIYAMRPAEWLGRIHPDDPVPLVRAGRHIAGRGPTILAYRFLTKEGQYRWILDRIDVIADSDGVPRYGVGFLRERERMARGGGLPLPARSRTRREQCPAF
jgi:PAS domain S-box-containing protein